MVNQRQSQQLLIPHPNFHRQSRFLVQIRPPNQPAHLWHVSHIYELIKYSDVLVNHSGPIDDIRRRTVPFGYEFVAATWNDNAPATLRKRFTVLSPASAGGDSSITITGGKGGEVPSRSQAQGIA